PSFFGADKPKTYFVALINNAELRANGGSPLAYAFLTIDKGALHLVPGGSLSKSGLDNRREGFPSVTVPPAVDWYLHHAGGPRLKVRIPDTSMTPDFPSVAEAWSSILGHVHHKVDGVIQMDPFAVAAMLGQPQ